MSLPNEPLPNENEMIQRLPDGEREIILIGTAHVSKQSVQLVQTMIEQEIPDTVSVELCRSRFYALRQKDRWRNTNIVKVVREKKAFLLLSNLLMASFQKRLAEKLDIRPGAEMLQAIKTAEAVGAEIHLADRDIQVTLSRTWRTMRLWNKLKLLFQLFLSLGAVDEIGEKEIEEMKKQDVLATLLSEITKSLPDLKAILIDERDRYLAQKIKTAPGNKILAVVGAGHLAGILKYWDTEQDIKALEVIPPPKAITGVFKWGLPIVILGLFIMGFFMGGANTGGDMITWWVIANGALAGLGALVALAHPLTIVSSVVAAPLTSLNPAIAAGWVSGLVEAFSRKPRVKDLENLPRDIISIRGFWKNKVTRILLVVVFTNLGSAVGTFVAIPMMVKLLNT